MKTVNQECRVRSNRRRFLASTSALGAASLLGLADSGAAEPPPETTRIRLVHLPAICFAPQYLAEELLRLEGFTEVTYVEMTTGYPAAVVEAGHADLTQDAAAALVYALDSAKSTVVLGGIHVGCYELFGNERVRAVRDLEGKTIAIPGVGSGEHVLIASMLVYVGIDPRKDVRWVTGSTFHGALDLFVKGQADALVAFAPQPEELRAKKIGHLIVNTAHDRPWSQYFCCLLAANREFASRHPVAAKRALRAFLKAADICTREPERVARYFVAKGYEPRYEIALKLLKELPFNRWRQTDPEDTLRFLALRLQEGGMIESAPQKLISQNTDWRFLNELKKELKA